MESSTVQSVSSYVLDQDLKLRTPDGQSLDVHADELFLSEYEGDYTECRLLMTITPQVYGVIDREELLNLKRSLRRQAVTFNTDSDLEIEAKLDSALLPYLSEQVGKTGDNGSGDNGFVDIDQVAAYLVRLSQGDLENSLLATENWYGMKVTQAAPVPSDLEGSLRQGYTTVWLGETLEAQATPDPLTFTGPMYNTLIEFFSDCGIPFLELRDRSALEFEGSGYQGTWTCFVQVQEDQHRCLLYSQSPERAPEETREAMANFLVRANYGLPLGCFEMDFEDGDVRFRTSLDVTDDRLSHQLVNNLLMANLAIMDQYLPGIRAVIAGTMSPEEAINRLEA
ncbi:MAG: YbjN domain-containing protein [Pseudanabaenales cyanobacterium]|nr:YbjN domain-containing protein [Pseudanabaenales cyanobacterium]